MAQSSENVALPDEEHTHRSSLIDRWVNWIDNLGMLAWAFYLVAVLGAAMLIELSLWIDGALPFGTYGMPPAVFPPVILLFLALYHYLTGVSSQALHNFSPLLDVGEDQLARIEEDFVTLPRRTDWLLIALSFPMAIPFVWGGASTWGDFLPNTQLPYFVMFLIIVPFNYTFASLVVRSFRQIRMIRILHAQATNIELKKLEPAHAFSTLTSRTGISLFLSILFGFFYNPNAVESTWSLYSYILIVIISVAIFIVPIMGIRRRLQEEKRDELHRIEDLIRITNRNLHQKVEKAEFDDLGGIQNALNMLTRERDEIMSVSTWPWNPGTIRGFASTLILPILLRYLNQLLDTFF